MIDPIVDDGAAAEIILDRPHLAAVLDQGDVGL
jgi:hypothetical protein